MAVSRNQRLRKAAAKAVKRKAVVAQKLARQRHDRRVLKPHEVDLATSPIVGCFAVTDEERQNAVELFVARKLPHDRYGVATFLLDTWCLGLMDAFFEVDGAEDFEDWRDTIPEDQAIEPERARKLLDEVSAFGAANGFPPPPEFAAVIRLLSDVTPAEESVPVGDNGRPHFLVSEYDSAETVEEIVETLTQALGPGGFDVTYPLEDDAAE